MLGIVFVGQEAWDVTVDMVLGGIGVHTFWEMGDVLYGLLGGYCIRVLYLFATGMLPLQFVSDDEYTACGALDMGGKMGGLCTRTSLVATGMLSLLCNCGVEEYPVCVLLYSGGGKVGGVC